MLLAICFGPIGRNQGSLYGHYNSENCILSFILNTKATTPVEAYKEVQTPLMNLMGFSDLYDYIEEYPGLTKEIYNKYEDKDSEMYECHDKYYCMKIYDDFFTDTEEHNGHVFMVSFDLAQTYLHYASMKGFADESLLIVPTMKEVRSYPMFEYLEWKDLWFCEDCANDLGEIT